MDEDDIEELLQLQHEMEITIREVRESEHYQKFREQLYNNKSLQNELSHRLQSKEQIQMVIYGLGSLEYNFNSHYQLALALLLKEEVAMLRIGEIQVFDPKVTPADVALIRSLGCIVLSTNEYARRKVKKPTLFFLPFPWFSLVANLLETNWSSSGLNNLIILGSSMHDWCKSYEGPDYGIFFQSEITRLERDDRHRYMQTIKDWSIDFTVEKQNMQMPFNLFKWVFFNLQSKLDINSFLPSNSHNIYISKYMIN